MRWNLLKVFHSQVAQLHVDAGLLPARLQRLGDLLVAEVGVEHVAQLRHGADLRHEFLGLGEVVRVRQRRQVRARDAHGHETVGRQRHALVDHVDDVGRVGRVGQRLAEGQLVGATQQGALVVDVRVVEAQVRPLLRRPGAVLDLGVVLSRVDLPRRDVRPVDGALLEVEPLRVGVQVDGHVHGVEERAVLGAGLPPARVLHQLDRLVVGPLLHHVGARADRLLAVLLRTDLIDVLDRLHEGDGVAQRHGEVEERVLQRHFDGVVVDLLDPGERVAGAVARVVGALDRREDVARVVVAQVGVGVEVPRIDEVLRRDCAARPAGRT